MIVRTTETDLDLIRCFFEKISIYPYIDNGPNEMRSDNDHKKNTKQKTFYPILLLSTSMATHR